MQRPLTAALFALMFTLAVQAPVAGAQVMRWGGEHEVPDEVEGTNQVTRIDAGNASGYALTSAGTVLAWGNGKYGALGTGTLKNSEAAVQVHLPAGVKVLSLGEAERSGFAVTSTGHVYAWGMNKRGDLCLGEEGENETKVTTPQEVPGVTDAVAVQGAKNHVLIVLANGTVESCGWGPEGQLGLGKAIREVTTPTPVPGLEHIVEVSAGPEVSAARTASGELFVFGSNQEGQVAQVRSVHQLWTPTRLRLPGPVTSISVGGGTPLAHTEALVEGIPYCWGSDVAGECGDGSEEAKYTPVVASELTLLGPLRAVIAAGLSTIALTTDGNVYTVGEEGELGIPGGEGSFSPQLVEGGVVEISGTAHDHADRHP